MRIQLIKTGEIEEVDGLWGERLIEQGKALPVTPKAEKPKKAEVTVTDKVPETAKAAAAPKAEPAKKAGKKR